MALISAVLDTKHKRTLDLWTNPAKFRVDVLPVFVRHHAATSLCSVSMAITVS